jgi:two-component system cell cycle response regulator
LKSNTNILLVDSDQAQTTVLSEVLKKAGYNPSIANDGFKALAQCKVRTPDLIVVDLHMPLMGGLAVANRLKAEEKTNGLPFIYVGNRGQEIPKIVNSQVGEEDVLIKPVQAQELLARIKALLMQKSLTEELKKKEAQLKELSLFDPETALKSPRYMEEFLKTAIKQSRRYKVPVSVLVVGIDHHEQILQKLGREASDELVAELAKHATRQMRDSDIAARTGAFEITIVLTVTDCVGAIELAERLRHKVKQTGFNISGRTVAITVSTGICQFTDKMDDQGKIVLSHARAALAEARTAGGDVSLKAE